MKLINSLVLGIIFGILLTKSEVISWFRIHDMFLFNEPHMYLIIGSAVITGVISFIIIRKFEIKTIEGKDIVIEKKQLNTGTVIGGVLFGVGWAITGACPGPIFAQIGAGETAAVVTLAGAVIGAYLFNSIKRYLP